MAEIFYRGVRAAKREILRARLLHRRGRKDSGEASRRIMERLLAHKAYRGARTIMCYVSVEGEVQTEHLIRAMLAEGKTVSVPWCEPEGCSMHAAVITDFDHDLQKGHFDIPAPPASRLNLIDRAAIRLFIVPGIGFDLTGTRMGRGRGYYDRYLADLTPHACTIGLAFERQIVRFVPREKHDVQLDRIITEMREIDCGAIRRRAVCRDHDDL